MDSKQRRLALLRVHAALTGAPEPSRAHRRAAVASGRRKGGKRRAR